MSHQETKHQTTESSLTYFVNWILRIIPAGIVGRAAWMKLSGSAHASWMFEMLDMEPGGRILIGLIEALCVVLLLSPRISAWGAILCLGVMIGAVIAHSTVCGFDGELGVEFSMALAAGGSSLALIYQLRHQAPFVRDMFDV